MDDDIPIDYELNVEGNTAMVVVSSGTGPYTFVWDGNVGNSEISDLAEGTHELKIIDGLGCEKIESFDVLTSSSIDIQQDEKVTLYPNPSTGTLQVLANDLTLNTKNLSLWTLSGQKIHNYQITKHSDIMRIDISELEQGYYILSLNSESNTINKKFLKM